MTTPGPPTSPATSRAVPRRISQAVLASLGAGVVPRIGLEHVAVGRREEIAALLRDLETVGEGGAAFRLIVGRFGSGKSFLLQLLRNYALERGFAVADADLSPERRLTGTGGQGLATYRELMRNLSTKARSDGGALGAILERWISAIQVEVAQAETAPDDPGFDAAVEARILATAQSLQELVSGFDFAKVVIAYWRGYRLDQPELREQALRWLRGEFTTKTEARAALDVRVYIDDDSWYDSLKLMAGFVTSVGYRGLLVVIDEAVNLSKIVNPVSRQANYEKLLTIFNDTMQGKASHLGVFLGGTPPFVEDPRRGLFSYEALRSRLTETRFQRDGLRDTSGPVLRLAQLTTEESFVLLHRIAEVHAVHAGTPARVADADITDFMQETANRVGADALLTPRDMIREFIAVLNILEANPSVGFRELVHGKGFTPRATKEEAPSDDRFADFTL